MNRKLSVVIPSKNEANSLSSLLSRLIEVVPGAEIIVVDDGSTDETLSICQRHDVSVVKLPHSVGNGGAVKAGVRRATGDVLVLLDGDGQHDPRDLPELVAKLDDGYLMVVGARTFSSQASVGRAIANRVYSWLASWMVGHRVEDLTSGYRVAESVRFKEFMHLLPNGFSYPTTITMAFFRSGYPIAYVPIEAGARTGKSHVRLLRDGARFLLIIFKIGTLYSPLKLFVPVSAAFFLTGFGYYAYTLLTTGRFTNMSALLFTTSVVIFLIGLVSEQITQLLYSRGRD